MILSAVLSVICIVLLMVSRKRAEWPDEEWKKLKLPKIFLRAGQMLSEKVSQRKHGGKIAEFTERKKKENGRAFGLVLIVATIGSFLSIPAFLLSSGPELIESIERPEFGEEKQVIAQVKEGGEKIGEISVPISGRTPSKEEWDAVFDEAYEQMKAVWLNDNVSFQEVRKDLSFPDETEAGIRITYRSQNIDILSDWGIVLTEEISEAGEEVLVLIRFSYEDAEKEYELPIRVFPALTEEKSLVERIRDQIIRIDQDTANDKQVNLPTEFDGNAISFETVEESPYLILLLTAVLAGCLFFLPGQKEKEREKKRKEALEREYPDMLRKLRTLINAGMSTRNAWFKIAENYQESLSKDKKRHSIVYEEMLISETEIKTGISEESAYVRFGRRCGLRCYVRFGNLLAQNLRQGISGLERALQKEAEETLEEQRTRVLRTGEKAKTKQLFPMLLMLGIVIVMLIAPTLMSF